MDRISRSSPFAAFNSLALSSSLLARVKIMFLSSPSHCLSNSRSSVWLGERKLVSTLTSKQKSGGVSSGLILMPSISVFSAVLNDSVPGK